MRLTIVADTGALLSLALSGLLDVCKQHFRIIAGEKVLEEIEEISLNDDELGKAAKTKADVLISDDIEFVKKHRKNEKISFSVILFGILLERKIITKKEFINAVNVMFEKREWEENLIYLVAKNLLEEE